MRHTRLATLAVLIGISGAQPLIAHDDHDPGNACAAVAYAVPLENITIDGKLDDWPKDTIQYPLRNNSNAYGPTDLDDRSLANNPDLTANFMVGYSTDKQVVYVAFVVRDESHVPFHPDPEGWFAEIDATEIYFDALHAERHNPWYERSGLAHLAAIGYAGIASNGGAYQTERNNAQGDNPMVYFGRLKDTQAQMKWSRLENRTLYEFAVQIYDRFPQVSELKPGKRIGFDAVIVDMDLNDGKVTDHAAWIPFGQREGGKFLNASSLADMVFVADRQSLGSISGRLKAPDDKMKCEDLVVEAWQGMVPGGEAHCAADGTFTLHLPAGQYMLRPQPGQGIAPFKVEIDVNAGQVSQAEARIEQAR